MCMDEQAVGNGGGGSWDWQAALAEHDRWLRTVLFARLRDRQAVEEVMQEVAVAAIEQKSPLADTSKLPAWLYRLAVRRSLMYRRAQGRQRRMLERAASRNGAAPEFPSPLDWLLADERRTLVRRALERLPRRDAEILLLKYAHDWSYRQLAHHLGISVSAVEARLHRARGRLRAELALRDIAEREE